MSEEREFEEFEIEDEMEDDFGFASERVKIFVESTVGPSQSKRELEVALDTPVQDLKFTLANMFSLPDPSGFHVVIAGRTCDDDDLLANYDLENGDTILLIPFSTAG